jgi:transcriptional regulator with XRE-family HTH domain
MYISLNIKYLRLLNELSQEALGEGIDSSKSSISSYENKKSLPDADVILSLCRFFGTDPNTLLLCDMQKLGLVNNNVVGIQDLINQLGYNQIDKVGDKNGIANKSELSNTEEISLLAQLADKERIIQLQDELIKSYKSRLSDDATPPI